MEFRDLKKQYHYLKSEIDAAIVGVATSGTYIGGEQVNVLEKELAAYVGTKHCLSCANGTDALSLALMAWGIKEGDAVFVPDFTFFASAEVVASCGATPIFVDVEKETFNICPISLEASIDRVLSEGRLIPKVILTVDLFGLPANYPLVRQVADKHKLLILEDGAQGFGGKIGNKRACSFGDISTTSFFPAKPLGCYGDGGAIFTDNDQWASLIQSLKLHGKGMHKYDNVRIGINSRMDSIQAAILRVKFNAFKAYELEAINSAAERYTERLKESVQTPTISTGFYSSWAQYTILLDNQDQRNALQTVLKKEGIPSMVYYPSPMHMQTAFAHLPYSSDHCPITNILCNTCLSLPLHPYMDEKETEQVAKAITLFLK